MIASISATEITRFFLAIILLVGAAQAIGYLFTRLKLPKAVGEITGGLLLGPTLLGWIAPSIYTRIFEQSGELLSVVYWLGLILLMFCSGFELKAQINKRDKKTITIISITSTIIPFALGWLAASYLPLETLIGVKQNVLALKLIIATSIAITSIPVISKIFLDLDMMKTRFARIVLGTATVHDLVLWVFLAIATSLVSARQTTTTVIISHILVTVVFFACALWILPFAIDFLRRKRSLHIPEGYESGFVILLMLFFVVVAGYLGINMVFGALLAGIVVGFLSNPSMIKMREHIKEVGFAFFIPLYFAIVGIQLNLVHSFNLSFFLIFLVFASLVQGLAVIIGARLLKYSWRASTNLAIAMNARGGPGIVIATVAFQSGIISESFFATLVMLAIITSLLAGAWLRSVKSKKQKLLDD